MTMLSFRVDESEAADLAAWADRLDVERSELLRRALHAYLVGLRSEADALAYEKTPLSEVELSLTEIPDWGPAEDWSDWKGLMVETEKPPETIGQAWLEDDNTIVLHLRAAGSGVVGHATLRYPPSDPRYQTIWDHLGGLKRGETKPVRPFPE